MLITQKYRIWDKTNQLLSFKRLENQFGILLLRFWFPFKGEEGEWSKNGSWEAAQGILESIHLIMTKPPISFYIRSLFRFVKSTCDESQEDLLDTYPYNPHIELKSLKNEYNVVVLNSHLKLDITICPQLKVKTGSRNICLQFHMVLI